MKTVQVPIEIRMEGDASAVQYEVVGSNRVFTLPSGDPVDAADVSVHVAGEEEEVDGEHGVRKNA